MTYYPQNPVPGITVGTAPSNTAVDLGQMRSNLASVLQPGMLGNTVANPMDSVIAQGGDAGLQLQNAIANSRMLDLGLRGREAQLQAEEQQWKNRQQQPGPLDWMGLGLSGYGALKSAGVFGGGYKPQVDFSQPDWSQFNG